MAFCCRRRLSKNFISKGSSRSAERQKENGMSGAAAIDGFAARMRKRDGGGLISAWIGMPDPLLVNNLAQEAFDAIVLDMQHGMWDMASAANGIGLGRLGG